MKVITVEQFQKEEKQTNLTYQQDEDIDLAVLEIIKQVRKNGDDSLFEFTEKFDGVKLESLIVSKDEVLEALDIVGEEFFDVLMRTRFKIRKFHEHQKEKSWFIEEENGSVLGQKVTPINNVGIYVPGGTAAYPSSVLMNAIPAQIAGVSNIYMTTPPQKNGKVNPYILAAATAAGVRHIYKVGGAQSIAALAYGTETIPKVDKIVGPGNAYVASAKKWVFGDVGIDMIAGPSEICVVADDTAEVKYVAADLLSQAEHDELATAICITTSEAFANSLRKEVIDQTKTLERKEIIEKSLKNNGRIIIVDSLEEAFNLVNDIAPEHLQMMVENPLEQIKHIQNAGAIFLGNYSPEALGDYVAGPNHTLPTNGTATFSSPLGVYDFIKRSSIIHYQEQALKDISNKIIALANAEGLTAHAKSIEKRMEDNDDA